MSTSGRIVRNTAWLYAKMGISVPISLITTRIVLNSLGVDDYGIFNVIAVAISMMGFVNCSLAAATQRFISYAEGEGRNDSKSAVFNAAVFLHLVIAAVVVLLLAVSGLFFFHGFLDIPAERKSAAVAVYAATVVSTVFSVMTAPYDAVMNAHENMRYFALVGILESVLKLLVACACLVTVWDKLVLYGILMAGIPLITLTIMRVYCHRNYSECRVDLRDSSSYMPKVREMAGFAGWNLFGVSFSMIGNYGQGILLNKFFGVAMNAAYGVVSQLYGQLSALPNNLMKAMNPVIVKSEGAGDRKAMTEWSDKACKFSYLVIIWAVVPLAVEGEWVLKIWLKTVPAMTLVFFQLQMIRFMLETTTVSYFTSLSAVGEVKELNTVTAILQILPVLVCIPVFMAGFPAYWLYIAFILVTMVQNVLKLLLCHKYFGLELRSYFTNIFIPLVSMSVLMCAAAFLPSLFMREGFVRFLVAFVFSMTVMAVSLRLFILDSFERKVFLKAVRKILSPVFGRKKKAASAVISDPDQAYSAIRGLLEGDGPCMISRYGSSELFAVLNCLSVEKNDTSALRYITQKTDQWWWNETGLHNLGNNAGFFPLDEDSVGRFSRRILEDSAEIDLLGSWLDEETKIEPYLKKDCKKVQLRYLEPFWSAKPWTECLKGRKVLVVHPFADDIMSQYSEHRQELFRDPRILPEFDLKVLKAAQTIGGGDGSHASWFEALEDMERQMDGIEYDICLIGCGAYGMPLAAHVRRMGMKAVHLGGALQLLFGIRGRRWEDPQYGVREWDAAPGAYLSLMNDNWIRPSKKYRPDSAEKVEDACYW